MRDGDIWKGVRIGSKAAIQRWPVYVCAVTEGPCTRVSGQRGKDSDGDRVGHILNGEGEWSS